MKNKAVLDRIVDDVMRIGIDHCKDIEARAKLYRKAGLDLLTLAALMEAETHYAD